MWNLPKLHYFYFLTHLRILFETFQSFLLSKVLKDLTDFMHFFSFSKFWTQLVGEYLNSEKFGFNKDRGPQFRRMKMVFPNTSSSAAQYCINAHLQIEDKVNIITIFVKMYVLLFQKQDK